jgi:hypothetical protein
MQCDILLLLAVENVFNLGKGLMMTLITGRNTLSRYL